MLSRALVVFLAVCGPAVAEDGRPHVALVVGTLHYSPDLSVPLLAPELQRFGFRTTVVQGEGDPEKKTVNMLLGIEVLDEADVAVFSRVSSSCRMTNGCRSKTISSPASR